MKAEFDNRRRLSVVCFTASIPEGVRQRGNLRRTFQENDLSHILNSLFPTQTPTSVPTATTECLAVLTKILRFNHRERPTALECLQMDFFAHGVPPAVDDYHPPTAEQAREERLQRRALRGRRHSGEGDKSEWDIVFNDDMDVEPYLL